MSDKCPGCGAKGERTETSGLCNLSVAGPRAKFDCGTVLYGKDLWFHSATCHQNQIEALKGEVKRLQAVAAEAAKWGCCECGLEMWDDPDPEEGQPCEYCKKLYYALTGAITPTWEEVDE